MTTKEGLANITSQVIYILDQLEDAQLTEQLEVFNNSTIGQHIRHIYDFYTCIISASRTGHLDYANRERDPVLEKNCVEAIDKFERTIKDFLRLDEDDPISVVAEYDAASKSADRSIVRSTLGREMMYAHDHALHHLAIIKIGLQTNFPNIKISKEVGVAPSTIRYRMTAEEHPDERSTHS